MFGLLPALESVSSSNTTEDSGVDANNENVTALALLFGPSLTTRNIIEYCMEFDDDSPYEGEACLKVDTVLQGEIMTSISTQPQDCTLLYNGAMCVGCTTQRSNGEDEDTSSCVTADCTVVAGVDTLVNTCAGTGLTGPFQIFDSSLTATTNCGDTSPVEAPTDAPVGVAPTDTPVVAALTDAPVVTSPTDVPVVSPTDAPTTAPVADPSPVGDPPAIITAPTDAPVITTDSPVGVTDEESTDAPAIAEDEAGAFSGSDRRGQWLLSAALMSIGGAIVVAVY